MFTTCLYIYSPGELADVMNSGKGLEKAAEGVHKTYDVGDKAYDVGQKVNDQMKDSGCTTLRGAFMLAPLLNILVVFCVSL